MERNTYQMAYECLNCKTVIIVEIRRGQDAQSSPPAGTICEYCGCNYFSHPHKPTAKEIIGE